jgi:hypothetical protein
MAIPILASAPDHPNPNPKWKLLVREALRGLGGTAPLTALYRALAEHPKAKENIHFRAKIRQAVMSDDQVERLRPGIWRLKHY